MIRWFDLVRLTTQYGMIRAMIRWFDLVRLTTQYGIAMFGLWLGLRLWLRVGLGLDLDSMQVLVPQALNEWALTEVVIVVEELCDRHLEGPRTYPFLGCAHSRLTQLC